MYKDFIPEINQSLQKTKKAIIALGCSFVQGHGAIADYIYKNYKFDKSIKSSHVIWTLSQDEKYDLVSKYPEIFFNPDDTLNFSKHENKNSFVNVLCKKYFNEQYTPINLGRSGNGNRATIKDLYFYPNIMWDKIEEYIVIYCPSGGERLDFIDDTNYTLNDHGRWVSAWPSSIDDDKGIRNKLWTAYKESLSSTKFEVIEQISHVQELLLWCKFHKAKLIIIPAFMKNYYTKEFFTNTLIQKVERDKIKGLQKIEKKYFYDKSIQETLKLWPWENMHEPDGCPTFVDLVMKQEFGNVENIPYFYTFLGTGTPDLWISPCCHPTAKAHDVFAYFLHKHIMDIL